MTTGLCAEKRVLIATGICRLGKYLKLRVKEFFTAALLIYSAPYFFGAQAVTHAAYGVWQIREKKEEEGKKLLVQAGKELAVSAALWTLGWYSWVPSAVLLAYNPLLFRVNLNLIEDRLIGEKRSKSHSAKINELGWKDVLPAIANNSLRLSDLFGMGEVLCDVPQPNPNKRKEE